MVIKEKNDTSPSKIPSDEIKISSFAYEYFSLNFHSISARIKMNDWKIGTKFISHAYNDAENEMILDV